MNKKIDQLFVDRFSEAENLCNNNKLHESLKIYMSLLKEHPNQVSVLNNVGLVHEKLHDFNKAIDFYDRCNALLPNQAVLINNLANAYTKLDKWGEAYLLLQKIIDTDFDNEKNCEKYALCLFKIKSKEETKDFVESVVLKYPENKILNRILGNSLLHLNFHRDGLKHLQKGAGFIEFDTEGVRYLN